MPSLYARLAPWLLDISELIMVLAACGLVFWSSRKKRNNSGGFVHLQHMFARVAYRKHLAIILPGALLIVSRVSLIPILGVPLPRWHDEFSYLLAGDTFAHGRLTNPAHPMGIHFETFHVIQQPTYMSMYPPGEGLVLAIGQILGHPWIGQLMVTATLCSVLVWTLQAWVPLGWAFLGGMLAMLRLGILSYWLNGYWSAALPALGGALLLGALPRITKSPRARDGLLMGLGAVILANTRPYEGFVLSIPVVVAMLLWLFKSRASNASRLKVASAVFLVLILGAIATCFYYWRVTGHPFVMTYQVNRSTYATAPYFLWQKPRAEPAYHHALMRDFYRLELGEFNDNGTLAGFAYRSWIKARSAWQFYLGPLFSVPLLFLPWALRDRRIRFPLIAGLVMLLGFAVQTWTLPHYVSPATAIIYILTIQCARHLWVWKRRTRLGAALVRILPLVAFVVVALRVVAAAADVRIEPKWPRGNLVRGKIEQQLLAAPGNDLIIVRYGPAHYIHLEWVYNHADIDHSPIIWARDMGENANEELLRYYPSRHAWLLQVDDDTSPLLSPYPVSGIR